MNWKIILVIFALILATSLVIAFVFFKPNAAGQAQGDYAVEAAFPNLTFNQPVGMFNAEDGTNRLFVLEQAGVIRVFENSKNTATSKVFLDLSDRVLYGGEQGLLGLAFHPNYADDGYFYVNYVADNPRRTVIARFQVTANDPDQADKNSELILLEVTQPFANHNGGQLAFGADGYLYMGLGDGGSGGDPFGNAQNRSSLLGKILRIDVNAPTAGANYGIPSDNPFAGNTLGYREEVYAYGLRNPWRFSFDPATGKLWVGDVGQDKMEEIDIVEKGRNYGWNIMEGTLCYSPATGCNQTGLELPVWEYSHDQGIAVIGGFVYHGSRLPSLDGAYVYGDYGSGKIWALQYNGTVSPSNTLLVDTSLTISSFGIDEKGELYLCAFDGKIYQLSNIAIPEFPSQVISVFLLAATLVAVIIISKKKITCSLQLPASRRSL
jgi:glucose/arabinose dehydrogenase